MGVFGSQAEQQQGLLEENKPEKQLYLRQPQRCHFEETKKSAD